MAIRRMVSGDVLGDDDFIALSGNAKWLYFYCLINTDDYGLFQGMSGILRHSETTEAELQELLQSGFLLRLSEKTYCISDFNVMNKLAGKRTPTQYQDEFNLLIFDKDKRYKLKSEAAEDEAVSIYRTVPMTEKEYKKQISRYCGRRVAGLERKDKEDGEHVDETLS